MFKLFKLIVLFWNVLMVFAIGPKGLKNQEVAPNEVRTCFEGYLLYSDGNCVQEINEDPIPVCVEGIVDGKRGCRVEVPYIMKCPDGFTRDSTNQCSYSRKIDATFYCPAGFSDNGSDCIEMVVSDTVVTCETGELIGNNCVVIERQPYIVNAQCPPDTKVDDNICWRVIEEFDCTGRFICQQACDELGNCSEVRMPGKGRAKLRMLKPKDKKRMQHEEIPNEDLVAVSKPYTNSIQLIRQICHRRVAVEPTIETSCPADFLDEGSGCIKELLTPPQVVCAESGEIALAGGCPPIVHRTAKIARCPEGTPVVDDQCDSLVIAPPLTYCPTGFDDNSAGACEGYLPAPLECATDLQMVDGRCLGRRIRQALTFRLAENFRPESAPMVAPPKGIKAGKKG